MDCTLWDDDDNDDDEVAGSLVLLISPEVGTSLVLDSTIGTVPETSL